MQERTVNEELLNLSPVMTKIENFEYPLGFWLLMKAAKLRDYYELNDWSSNLTQVVLMERFVKLFC